jgi:Uma2 family endonuclease
MDISRIRMTNAQYMAMPDDGKRYELHDGVLIEMPSPTMLHGWIVSMLLYALMNYVYGQKLGYVFGDNLDYILNEGIIYRPDVSFVAATRVPILPDYLHEAPDIAVEVLSPSNTASEMNYKTNAYFQYGARLVWIVDPDRKIVTVYRPGQDGEMIVRVLSSADTLTGGDVLPDFRLPLKDLFGAMPSE